MPMKESPRASRGLQLLESIGLALLVLALGACAHQTVRWTPATVAPPASLDAALDRVDRDTLPLAPQGGVVEAVANAGTPEASRLTRDGAILTALSRNRSLAVERFETDIAQTSVQEARASFDPTFALSSSYSEANLPYSGGAGTSAGTGAATGTGDLADLSRSLSALSNAIAVLEDDDVQTSRRSDNTVRLSEYAPTGTELFLAGGYGRDSSSVVSDADYEGTWSVGVNQALLQGAGTALNLVSLRQSRNSTAASEHALRSVTMDVVESVENAYWSLVLANETEQIRLFSVQLTQEQLNLNEALISVGKLAESARISAEAAVASSEADLVDAQANVRSRAIELWRLMNPECEAGAFLGFTPTDAPETVLVDLDAETSVRLAELYRPELAQARLSLANRDLEVIRTKNGLLPKLDFSASYGRTSSGTSSSAAGRHLDDGYYDDFQVGLSFEVSLTNRAERARHLRAMFQQEQAEASVSNLEQLIEAEVRQAAVEAERQWQRIQATEKEVASREEELRVEQDQFRVGRSTNLDVLQVQQGLIQAKVDEVTARVGYIQAITALYRTEGTLLERRGVSVETTQEEEL
ncbi:MAG TPA: TolC family protein [Candidatus Hydrogenedentes bacterium]|nr:TolC family protein [Candidatus Hydrogenedentota bacterium]